MRSSCFRLFPARQTQDNIALHHLRVSQHLVVDQPGGAHRVGAGGLPHHHRGHHHHGQRGCHRRHLGGDHALRVAVCGVSLPDPGGGAEHGIRQSQGSPGG